MAGIEDAHRIPKGLSLDDKVGIFESANDPSSVGFTAPIGSLLLQHDGKVWNKDGATDTDWNDVISSTGASGEYAEAINVVWVDSNATEVTSRTHGRVYNTIASAVTYVNGLSRSMNNQWKIIVYSNKDTSTFTLKPHTTLEGNGCILNNVIKSDEVDVSGITVFDDYYILSPNLKNIRLSGELFDNATLNLTTTIVITDTSDLVIGQAIRGEGIPHNTQIQSITNGTDFVITNSATITGTGRSILVGGQIQLLNSSTNINGSIDIIDSDIESTSCGILFDITGTGTSINRMFGGTYIAGENDSPSDSARIHINNNPDSGIMFQVYNTYMPAMICTDNGTGTNHQTTLTFNNINSLIEPCNFNTYFSDENARLEIRDSQVKMYTHISGTHQIYNGYMRLYTQTTSVNVKIGIYAGSVLRSTNNYTGRGTEIQYRNGGTNMLYSDSSSPSIDDDDISSNGTGWFHINAEWYDTSTKTLYKCTDNTTGNAVWQELGGGGGLQNNDTGSDPTVSNDGTEGYAIGSLWTNTTSDETFICNDASTGAAIWKNITSDDIIGNRTYTGQNYINNSELITTSLDALDVQIKVNTDTKIELHEAKLTALIYS